MGIINWCPHLLQEVVASGGKSPAINIFALQPGHATILRGLRLSVAADISRSTLAPALSGTSFMPVPEPARQGVCATAPEANAPKRWPIIKPLCIQHCVHNTCQFLVFSRQISSRRGEDHNADLTEHPAREH
jgi:hypothetical protein